MGGVDPRSLDSRECHAFRRQTLRQDEMGAAFSHEATVCDSDLAERNVSGHAEDRINILATGFIRVEGVRA